MSVCTIQTWYNENIIVSEHALNTLLHCTKTERFVRSNWHRFLGIYDLQLNAIIVNDVTVQRNHLYPIHNIATLQHDTVNSYSMKLQSLEV